MESKSEKKQIKITGEGLISAFKKFIDLPESGFVAGGSVANVLIAAVHGINTPVRDIDVFVPATNEKYNQDWSYRHCDWEMGISPYGVILREQGYFVIEDNKNGLIDSITISSS